MLVFHSQIPTWDRVSLWNRAGRQEKPWGNNSALDRARSGRRACSARRWESVSEPRCQTGRLEPAGRRWARSTARAPLPASAHPLPPHPHPDSLPQTALTFHCPSQKLFAMTDEMAEQTLVLPSLRPLGQSLCPEVPPWWLWALGAGPKHPCSKTRGFLGDKRTVSSKVLLVTEDSQEQGFADLAACRSHPGSAPGQLSQDLEGKCTHFHFW